MKNPKYFIYRETIIRASSHKTNKSKNRMNVENSLQKIRNKCSFCKNIIIMHTLSINALFPKNKFQRTSLIKLLEKK